MGREGKGGGGGEGGVPFWLDRGRIPYIQSMQFVLMHWPSDHQVLRECARPFTWHAGNTKIDRQRVLSVFFNPREVGRIW